VATASPQDDALLRAVIDRILPRDRDPGALDMGTDGRVVRMLATARADMSAPVAAGLAALRAAEPRFAYLPPARQDAALRTHEQAAWFGLLCELVAEGAYADPAQGGNAGGASGRMIGYRADPPPWG
jgi:hypothetical protein